MRAHLCEDKIAQPESNAIPKADFLGVSRDKVVVEVVDEPISWNGVGDSEEEEDSVIPDGHYEVEEVLDYACDGKEELYFIKWKGWAEEHNTWEPPASLHNCVQAKIEFYNKRKAEIDEVMAQSEYFMTENGRKRRKGPPLKITLPPDPRPLDRRADEFYKVTARFPTPEETRSFEDLWKKDFKKQIVDSKSKGKAKSKNVFGRWSRLKLDNALKQAVNGKRLTGELDTELRFQLYIQQLDESREIAAHDLKIWEAELNEISEKKPLIKVENDVDWAGPPLNFTYINDYRPVDVEIPDDPLVGCSCLSCNTKDKDCCVFASGGVFAYTPYKKVKVPPGTPIYECNSKCQCGPDCANRVVQDGRENLVQLRLCIFRTSNNCGWGIKTLNRIKKGTFVSLYLGEVIKTDEAERRGKEYDRRGCTYLFDLDVNEGASCPYTVDAARYGNITHFINHSCDPNLAVYNVFVNCLDPNLPKLALFATRDIHKGEQLSFDYKHNFDSSEEEEEGSSQKTQPCLCGAANCRKFLFQN